MRPIASQIVSICRPSKNMDELLEFALIVDSQELAVSCVLITEEIDLATDRDLILTPDQSGASFELAVLTLAEIIISPNQIVEVIGEAPEGVLGEIVFSRYLGRSALFETGRYLLPLKLDSRHDVLVERIRQFIDEFSSKHPTRFLEMSRYDRLKLMIELNNIDGVSVTVETAIELEALAEVNLEASQFLTNETVSRSSEEFLMSIGPRGSQASRMTMENVIEKVGAK